MVDPKPVACCSAPNLGWRDLRCAIRSPPAVGLPVEIENSGKACALAQLWSAGDARRSGNFVYLNVSDGLGVGMVLGGELVRGQHNIAGEFGHVPLNLDGPRCGCGATGCWEAYVSNLATLSRYFGRDLRERPVSADVAALTVDDLIARARGGDAKALAALLSTGALSRSRPGRGRQRHRPVARLHRRRDHGGVGLSKPRCERRSPSAR